MPRRPGDDGESCGEYRKEQTRRHSGTVAGERADVQSKGSAAHVVRVVFDHPVLSSPDKTYEIRIRNSNSAAVSEFYVHSPNGIVAADGSTIDSDCNPQKILISAE